MSKTANSITVSIFIAGCYTMARDICRAWCDAKGGCVTVTEMEYVYTGGSERGVIVGFINYPPHPSTEAGLMASARDLAEHLCSGLDQQSYTIQGPTQTTTEGR